MDVQAVAGLRGVRLRHERRAEPVLHGRLLDDVLEHHGRIGHLDRRAVPEVHLDLRGPVLDVAGLDLDAGGLEHAADVADDGLDLGALRDRVAVRAAIERLPVRRAEVELELGRRDRLVALALRTRSTARRRMCGRRARPARGSRCRSCRRCRTQCPRASRRGEASRGRARRACPGSRASRSRTTSGR